MSKRTTGYVAYCKEHLRDGVEECARVFDHKEDALAWIEKLANGFAGDNCKFALFTLGERIELAERVEQAPQPPTTKRRFTEDK